MASPLSARQETTDGSRPEHAPLGEAIARAQPLVAFAVLAGGDAFEGGALPKTAERDAHAYVDTQLIFASGPAHSRARVKAEAVRVLKHNPALVARLARAKAIAVDVVPAGGSLAALGYPRANERAVGLFWDRADWPQARIALRADVLAVDEVLVPHELAHAIHGLAFTKDERALIDRVLTPVFVDRNSIDEAFAIYTEREFCRDFGELERRAPGIYGYVRRQWSEDHVFTRVRRKLYFPHRPLAGPKLGSATSWKRFSSG